MPSSLLTSEIIGGANTAKSHMKISDVKMEDFIIFKLVKKQI